MANLMTYNCFGLIRISKTAITINITAVADNGKPINRSLSIELPEPIISPDDEYKNLIFGAMISDNGKTRIATREINGSTGLSGLPQVVDAISKAVNMISIASKS